jgi:hypothetical protein
MADVLSVCSVQLGTHALVQPLMQSQQGCIRDLSWDLKAPGSIATASTDGSVCVWDSQVCCSAWMLPFGRLKHALQTPTLI